MVLFLVAATAVYGALLAATLRLEREFFFEGFEGDGPLFVAVLSTFVVPVLATWLSGEVINTARSCRLFHPRAGRRVTRVVAGLGAGVVGVVLGALMLILLDRSLPDASLTGVAAIAATTLVLVPMPRVKKSGCPHCGYDLSGASPSAGGVCTECGFDVLQRAS